MPAEPTPLAAGRDPPGAEATATTRSPAPAPAPGASGLNLALVLILATVALDAIGIGLIAPVLPQLLDAFGVHANLALHAGALTALYALMQFVCAPALGALSDRFGRRPVLLCSLFGSALDYLLMACAPWLSLLYLGRAIAGVSGASGSVAGAYIADISDESQRARRYGWLGASFGLGLVAGPVIGGLLGAVWLRAPFLAAAALATLNFALAWLALPSRGAARAGAAARGRRCASWRRGTRCANWAGCRTWPRCCGCTWRCNWPGRCRARCGRSTATIASVGTRPRSACRWRRSGSSTRCSRPSPPAASATASGPRAPCSAG
ncbi:TCR/Tet family MFS transporter [Lysobacter enzymogenes]|nr:TCR/Tet family MFS transporter [Lysobacter enzymogenes]